MKAPKGHALQWPLLHLHMPEMLGVPQILVCGVKAFRNTMTSFSYSRSLPGRVWGRLAIEGACTVCRLRTQVRLLGQLLDLNLVLLGELVRSKLLLLLAHVISLK